MNWIIKLIAGRRILTLEAEIARLKDDHREECARLHRQILDLDKGVKVERQLNEVATDSLKETVAELERQKRHVKKLTQWIKEAHGDNPVQHLLSTFQRS